MDNAGDVVLEVPGAGTDEVRSSISYTLALSVENLRLLGSSNRDATGNAQDNVIIGNAGNNRIVGGLGRDTLTGNAGADRFVFNRLEDSASGGFGADLITDFSSAEGDRIRLTGIDAVSATAQDDAFAFIGTSAFSAAGQVRTFVSGGVTNVAINTDNNLATTEMVIALTGNLTLSASDFQL